jgi:tripartite-type tricarboxylate transporter receptor subunit TctC
MKIRHWLAATIMATALAVPAATTASAEWKPTKPIRIIVPWGAGGSTDQLIRVLQGELENALGQKVIVVNQTGGAGAVGTKAAWEAEKDGYTWTAGAAWDLGTYVVTGALDAKIQDWHLFLATANYMVLAANPNSKLQSVEAVKEAMNSDPSSVTIATAGINSSGGMAAELLKAAAGGDYKMITYDGGNPAVQAAVAHETELTTQLVAEEYEMLRAGRLKPLAAFTPEAVDVPEIGTVPSILDTLPNATTSYVLFGIWAPKGIPEEVVQTMGRIWDEKIANSEALKEYAKSKAQAVKVMWGEEAAKAGLESTQIMAWQLHAGGKSAVSPDTVGIPPLKK